MLYALLVCALVLVMVVYFAALLTGEIALWLYNRLSQREDKLNVALRGNN
jgi:hypothetical protein